MSQNLPIDCRNPVTLFVVGMWRSGTSLVYALLNKHPQIALLYEGDLLLLRPLFRGGKTTGWGERWDFWNNAVTRHGIQPAQVARDGDNLASAVQRTYGQYAEARGATVCGEKSPNYYDRMAELAQMFPGARFLVVWRDPVAVCESVLRAAESEDSWFARRGMVLRALLGCRTLKRERDRLKKAGVPVYDLEYEKLVADPAAEMAGVCEFLDLPYLAEVASLQGADRSSIYSAEHHARVRSSEISRAKRKELLPPATKEKIARYVTMWRRESSGAWPSCSVVPEVAAAEPSLAERAWDSLAYRLLRAWDELIVRIYCLAPLPLLARFRERKQRAHRKLVSQSIP